MSDLAHDAALPTEQLPITIFDAVVLSVRDQDGTISLAIRDLCQAMSLDAASQRRRIRTHALLQSGMHRFRVTTAGGEQAQEFLELELVPTWLLMINTARVAEAVRPRLSWFQRYIVREVYRAFTALAGLPEQASQQIEDLGDLQHINTALTALAARQDAVETSQDQARQAWRDIRADIRAIADRVAAVEQRVGAVISREQRGYVYQLVQAWGTAKAARESRLSSSAAFAACWATLKTRYRIARYEDLPATQYDDCVRFVQQAYRQLTGEQLDLPEQPPLDLDLPA